MFQMIETLKVSSATMDYQTYMCIYSFGLTENEVLFISLLEMIGKLIN